MELDVVLRAPRVITEAGEGARSVGVAAGRIAAIEPYEADLPAGRVVQLGKDVVLLPGLVDTHVHVDEPGRTEWEGFETATRAAAAGGVTTIVDMPLNSIPATVDVPSLEVKRAAAEGRVHVDVGFWGGAVPDNLADLRGLHDAGVFGFKAFLLPSGVPEFPPLSPAEFEERLALLSTFDALMIVHAEDDGAIEHAPAPRGADYAGYLASRPREAEDLAISHVVESARRTGARVHVLHLSSSDALPLLRSARRDGVRLTTETCPHYLVFAAEEVPDGATEYKCAPPIREAENRDALWRGLEAGVIDFVVSDHSPAPASMKLAGNGDFAEAWGGIASLQLGLAITWTEARHRGIRLEQVVEWMSTAPAHWVGLASKGAIAEGRAADLAVVAPDEAFTVDAAKLEHRHPISPYDGRELVGVVRATYLAGEPVDRTVPRGRLLRRAQSEGGPGDAA